MVRFVFKYGLELECIVRRSLGVRVGGYHQGAAFTPSWKAEADGSLNIGNRDYDKWMTCEFVSVPFERESFYDVITELRRKIEKSISKDSFSNIAINDSCGAHIHFSVFDKKLGKTRIFFKKISLKHLKDIRDNIHSKVKREMNKLYPTFKEHYFRGAAVRMTEQSYEHGSRYQEFNCTTDKAMEWRSFHLRGVTRWSELTRMYELAFDSIEEVILEELYKDEPFSHKFEMPYKGKIQKTVVRESQDFTAVMRKEGDAPREEEFIIEVGKTQESSSRRVLRSRLTSSASDDEGIYERIW